MEIVPAMEKANLEQLTPFITADGSAIRELAGPAWTPVRHQSLAEATLPPGGETAEHYHPQAEELYYFVSGRGPDAARRRGGGGRGRRLRGDPARAPPHKLWNTGPEPLVLLCCCAPAYSDDDTVMTGG